MELRSALGDFRRARTFNTYKRIQYLQAQTVENWILEREREREKVFFNLKIYYVMYVLLIKQIFDENLYLWTIFSEVIDFINTYNKHFSNRLKRSKIPLRGNFIRFITFYITILILSS